MPMTPPTAATEIALLRAVAAHPDEDTPRLEYADYLDETVSAGDDRAAWAAFIRRQVADARAGVEYGCYPDRKRYSDFCHLVFTGFDPEDFVSLEFERGFLAAVRVRAAEKLFEPGVMEALFRYHPVRRVSLAGAGPGVSVDGTFNRAELEWWLRPGVLPGEKDRAGYARRRRVWDLIDFRGVGLSAAEAACLPAGEAYYRLRSRSEAAVSAAIVAYGRRLVDLPPLSPPPAPG